MGVGILFSLGKYEYAVGGRVPKERTSQAWRRMEGGDEVREPEGKRIRHFFLRDGREAGRHEAREKLKVKTVKV